MWFKMAKKKFVGSWKRSGQPRKQRKYSYNAPLHIQQKMMGVHLSPDLRKKYGTRSIAVRKGDRVRVMRGQFRKKEGKVERVSLKYNKVFVTGIETIRREGARVALPLRPSNLMILELVLDDKKRKQRLTKEKLAKVSAKKIKEDKK